MKEFHEISEFVTHLGVMAAEEVLSLHHGLKKCAVAIDNTAKAEIGHYQPDVGSFAGWVELADATKADRSAKGFSENDPLLRSGELRDSISHEIDGLEAVIGSTSDIMVYQECGTSRIPPRAVMGPAGVKNTEFVIKTLGHAAAEGLLYGSGTTLTALEQEISK